MKTADRDLADAAHIQKDVFGRHRKFNEWLRKLPEQAAWLSTTVIRSIAATAFPLLKDSG